MVIEEMASDVSMVVGKGWCCIAIMGFLDAAIIQIVLFFPQTRVKLPSHTEVRILHLILSLLHLFCFLAYPPCKDLPPPGLSFLWSFESFVRLSLLSFFLTRICYLELAALLKPRVC